MNNQILKSNYQTLMKLIPENIKTFARFKSDRMMDLTIDILIKKEEKWHIALSHYGKQNGDLMADPDVEVILDHTSQKAIPQHFQNDYLGVFQRPETPTEIQKLSYFLKDWLKNIMDQGYELSEVK